MEWLIYASLNYAIIGSDNGLPPPTRQAVTEPMLDYCLLEPEKQTSEFLSEIHTFSFKKMHLQMSPAKWRQFCVGLNVLK